MMTIISIAAQTHGIDIDGTKPHITKIMSASPRRIGEIVVEAHFPKPIADPKQREILERAAATRPVAQSLHPTANRPSLPLRRITRRSTGARRRFVRPPRFLKTLCYVHFYHCIARPDRRLFFYGKFVEKYSGSIRRVKRRPAIRKQDGVDYIRCRRGRFS